MNQIANGIGYGLLWEMGMIVIPMSIMLLHGWWTDFNDQDMSQIVLWSSFVLYWIITGIYLITL
jgi:hypothetical protein